MAVDKQVISQIRLRRQAQALQAALKVSEAVAEQLLQVSGVLERGVDPRKLRVQPQDLPELMALARRIEAEEAMLDSLPPPGRVAV